MWNIAWKNLALEKIHITQCRAGSESKRYLRAVGYIVMKYGCVLNG